MYNKETLEYLQECRERRAAEREAVLNEEFVDLREASDLELMIFLDESGYEPSVENVLILRDFNNIDESIGAAWDAFWHGPSAERLKRSRGNLGNAKKALGDFKKNNLHGNTTPTSADLEQYEKLRKWKTAAKNDVKFQKKMRNTETRMALVDERKYYNRKARERAKDEALSR